MKENIFKSWLFEAYVRGADLGDYKPSYETLRGDFEEWYLDEVTEDIKKAILTENRTY